MIPLISSIYQLGFESAGFRNLFFDKKLYRKKKEKRKKGRFTKHCVVDIQYPILHIVACDRNIVALTGNSS